MAVGGEQVLLIAEDDKEMRSLLCDELRDLGCRIVEAGDGNEAIERAREAAPHLILTDLRMPAGGFDHVLRMRTLAPECPIIVLTAFGDAATKETALKCGAAAYFDKPVSLVELKASVTQLLGQKNGSK